MANVTTASSTWLTLVATARPAASLWRTPRLARIEHSTVPSGMLCTAIASAVKMPKGRSTAIATPIAIPSAAEWCAPISSTL